MVTKRRARRRLWVVVGVLFVVVASAVVVLVDGGGGDPDGPFRSPAGWGPAVAAPAPDRPTFVLGSSPAEVADDVAAALLVSAPIVVVVPPDDEAAALEARELATAVQAPLVFATSGRRAANLLADLEVEIVLPVGNPDLPEELDATVVQPGADDERIAALIQDAAAYGDPTGGVVLVRPGDDTLVYAEPALASVGHRTVALRADDPRADQQAAERLAELDRRVVGVIGTGDRWSGVDRSAVGWQAETARAGIELPGGRQLLFPFRILVALYGTPETDALGALGEQDLDASIARAEELADAYQPFSDVPVVPAFELIVTVATGGPGDVGDYSRRVPADLVRRWVDAAGEAGVYVVLDLQPGRTDFLTQAREWADVLAEPHVGLALDAEWRLAPDQQPLEQIGSVSVGEVNGVIAWLARLTRTRRLPQKLLLVHQFDLDMIEDRAALDTSHRELAVAIQMDGNGPQAAKLETWDRLRTTDPPAGVWWGWKNFYDEDPVLRPPADVLGLSPVPVFVSYQ